MRETRRKTISIKLKQKLDMKKLIPILLAVFALVSCEKDPDMDKLDNEYLVFTSHDTSTKFNDFSTYISPTAS